MDPATVEVYEARAGRYQELRVPRGSARARDLAQRIGEAAGVRYDLGCGPGWNGPELGRPLVALDAARAMLELVPAHAPHALRVQADLGALPFRRGAGAGAWAAKSYIHVPRAELPLALWDLHRVLAVGAPAELLVHEAGDDRTGDETRHDADDLLDSGHSSDRDSDEGGESADGVGFDRGPRRFFSFWREGELLDLAHGAGFGQLVVERHDGLLAVRGVRERTLADTVGPGLRLLLVGLNPSLHAADAGYGFAGPGNRFWPALAAASIHLGPRDPHLLATTAGIGMTDLVKRASRRADEVGRAEFAAGLARIERLAAWLQPAAVCFVGLAGWRAAADRRAGTGWQDRTVGGRPAYVMPNPSGLNAHDTVASLAAHLAAAWNGPEPMNRSTP